MIAPVIDVIVKEPGKPGVMKQIASSLESMQATIGGYITRVPLPDNMVLYCDEEGDPKGLPFNLVITDRRGRPHNIVGTAVICRESSQGEPRSLTNTQQLTLLGT